MDFKGPASRPTCDDSCKIFRDGECEITHISKALSEIASALSALSKPANTPKKKEKKDA
jgi:hypothetical protein